MLERREEILARLAVLLGLVEGIETVQRNKAALDNDRRPAIVLLDGDETTKTLGDRRGRVAMSPAVVTMRPQVFILLKSSKPQNDTVGADINAFRKAVLAAIATDTEFAALIGSHGDIAYLGCETDLKSGGTLEGQMRMDFAITTALNPYAN
jgi:hypothetical protein